MRTLVASCLLVLLAGSAAGDEPPAKPPPDARFPTGQVSFPKGSVRFPSGQVSFPTGRVSFPTGRLAVPAISGREMHFTLTADVLFDFDRSELRPQAEGVLRDMLAQIRERMPRGSFRVEGHTDGLGTDAYNDALSQRRADSVRRWLVQAGGISAAAVRTEGFGKRRPVAPNQRPDGSDDPVGRQRNRRVEIVATPAR